MHTLLLAPLPAPPPIPSPDPLLQAIPLAYCYSHLFLSHSTAQIGVLVFNLTTGFVMVLAHQIMQVRPGTVGTAGRHDDDSSSRLTWLL